VSGFLARLHARAAARCPRVVFPEGDDPRTQQAIATIVQGGLAIPLALVTTVLAADAVRAAGGTPVFTNDATLRPVVTDALHAWAAARGKQSADVEAFALHPLAFGNALVAAGAADACVAGAVHTTADVLRWSMRLIGTTDGSRSVSGAFYMLAPDVGTAWPHDVLTFSDCGVIPDPTPEQLSDIAIAAAADRARIVGDEPMVAFLSFSTHGSAESRSVARVRDAVALTRARRPELRVDGELQGDAALSALVAQRKAPQSPVAGRANVLIFPSLDAGNIAYKLVQYLAGATAIGPIVQGLRKPSQDLSRGATAMDIVHVTAIAALQTAPV
jgi:phosphate acetyltransferase